MGANCLKKHDSEKQECSEFDEQVESYLIDLLYQDLSARSKSDTIDKDTFTNFFHLNGLWSERVFQGFDQNKSGELDHQQFKQMLLFLAKGDKHRTVESLFNFFDQNKDHFLYYSELLKMFYSYPIEDLLELFNDKKFLNSLTVREQIQFVCGTNASQIQALTSFQDLVEDETNQKQLPTLSALNTPLIPLLSSKSEEPKIPKLGQGGIIKSSQIKSRPFFKPKINYKVNVMIKRYIQQLFKEFGLNYRTGKLNSQQFQQVVQRHPKLLTIYMEGFHGVLWQRTHNQHWKDLPLYIQGEILVLKPHQNQKVKLHVRFMRNIFLLFNPADLTNPIQIIFLPGLRVSALKRQGKVQGFLINHRDGFYPEKRFYLKDQKKLAQWLEHLQIYFHVSVQEKYKLIDEIGYGGFSKVWKCQRKSDGKFFAQKIINKDNLNQIQKKLIKSEIQIFDHCHHPCIIKLQETFETQSNIYIVTELVQDGDLFDYLQLNNFKVKEETAALITEKVLQTICYLNDMGLIHRDIKPQNIMIQKDPTTKILTNIKIIDFGLATYLDTLKNRSARENCVGTPNFVAPEILRLNNYNEKVDVFSIGVVVYSMLSGKLPFDAPSKSRIRKKTLQGQFSFEDQIWKKISDDAKNFIKKLLIVEPQERPSPKQALRLKWLRNFRHEQLELSRSISSPSSGKISNSSFDR